MAEKRDKPYIWVTWVSKLMGGDSCHWMAWFKAHNKDIAQVRRGDDKDDGIKEWTANHTKLLMETKAEYEANGYTVLTEDQTAFCMVGKTGISVGGKCDLVCIKGNECIVIDIKTGKVRLSDYYQVQIYLIALRHTKGPWTDKMMRGLMIYPKPEKPVEVDPSKIEMDLFKKCVAIIGGDIEPKRAPSYQGCRYCEITLADCPDRVTEKPKASQTDLF